MVDELRPPPADTSWLKMEDIGSPPLWLRLLVIAEAAGIVALVIFLFLDQM